MKVLASDVRGKTVMSKEGLMLGRLRNIVINEATGDLSQILVEPAEDIDPRLFKRDNRGYLLFGFDAVRSVRDVVVVSAA